MKQRVFRPVESSSAGEAVSSRPTQKTDRLAVAIPMPDFSSAPPVDGGDLAAASAPMSDGDGYVLLDTHLIDQNDHPPRQIYSEEVIDALGESMRRDGQRDAIHVIEHPSKPGRYIIGDGWTRVLAIRAYSINNNRALARVHKGLSPIEASWLGYDQNEQRKQLTDYDKAIYYSNWHDSGVSWEDIAKKAGVSKTMMSFYSSFRKLSVNLAIAAKMHPQRITATVANLLVRATEMKGEGIALQLATQFVESDLPRKWLEERVEALSHERPQRRANAVNYQKRYASGFYKQRANGEVELKLNIDPDKIDDFNKRIQSLVDDFVAAESDQSKPV